jgi:hemerythrin-like domain-containing protein
MPKLKSLEKLDGHHREIEKILKNMEDVVANIQLGGEDAFQMHFIELDKLRIRILTKSMLHFLQEEQVLFPEIVAALPKFKKIINGLLKEHDEIKEIYSELVEAINRQNLTKLEKWATKAIKVLRSHIKHEDKMFVHVQGKWLTSEAAARIEKRLTEFQKAAVK